MRWSLQTHCEKIGMSVIILDKFDHDNADIVDRRETRNQYSGCRHLPDNHSPRRSMPVATALETL